MLWYQPSLLIKRRPAPFWRTFIPDISWVTRQGIWQWPDDRTGNSPSVRQIWAVRTCRSDPVDLNNRAGWEVMLPNPKLKTYSCHFQESKENTYPLNKHCGIPAFCGLCHPGTCWKGWEEPGNNLILIFQLRALNIISENFRKCLNGRRKRSVLVFRKMWDSH